MGSPLPLAQCAVRAELVVSRLEKTNRETHVKEINSSTAQLSVEAIRLQDKEECSPKLER